MADERGPFGPHSQLKQTSAIAVALENSALTREILHEGTAACKSCTLQNCRLPPGSPE
jgi:hypothetical protein